MPGYQAFANEMPFAMQEFQQQQAEGPFPQKLRQQGIY